MTDITSEADIRRLVDAFYGKIRDDALLNPIFADVAQVEWDEHLPKMYAFWSGIVLGEPGYSGNPFAAHVVLPVGIEHFQRWLSLFQTTVDELFAGPLAKRAKDAAASIAHTFAMRMGLIEPMTGRLL
jgi:hemoglobin